jgi:DNA-binding NarL/FixJ family response regulator
LVYSEGLRLKASTIRVLLVDDFRPWFRVVFAILGKQSELEVIGEASDGLEAVQKAQELQPDLILLDIGLPNLNGIEAARLIRKLSPDSKILFVSQESSADLVREALRTGAEGYVLKADAGRELLTAVNAALRGERFVGSRFADYAVTGDSDTRVTKSIRSNHVIEMPQPQGIQITHSHTAAFYSDDYVFLEYFTQFIGAALKAGNSAIVVATESHQDSLLPRLQAYGLDIGAAIKQGRYMALDAAKAVSIFMVNDLLDSARFLEVADNLIKAATESATGEHPRVALCGECDPPLWTIGSGEAAIRMERLWNVVAVRYNVDILCGYPLSGFRGEQDKHMFREICAEHSAVYSR